MRRAQRRHRRIVDHRDEGGDVRTGNLVGERWCPWSPAVTRKASPGSAGADLLGAVGINPWTAAVRRRLRQGRAGRRIRNPKGRGPSAARTPTGAAAASTRGGAGCDVRHHERGFDQGHVAQSCCYTGNTAYLATLSLGRLFKPFRGLNALRHCSALLPLRLLCKCKCNTPRRHRHLLASTHFRCNAAAPPPARPPTSNKPRCRPALLWWLATIACSPPPPPPTSHSLPATLAFLFLSPCPQRALTASLDLVFLVTTLALALALRARRHDDGGLDRRTSEWESLLATAAALLRRRQVATGSWVAAECALLAAHAIAHLAAVGIVAAEKNPGLGVAAPVVHLLHLKTLLARHAGFHRALLRLRGHAVKVCGITAYVAQTAWIQSGTIQDNILFGQQMHPERYKELVRSCCLEKDLEMMEFGDQTEIGERGINLSGGQKQRIQLARAAYQNCSIYLLDDVFSAVDAHTGSSIFKECIRGTLKGKTIILVTHQVDFLRNVDNIFVMRDGMIAQSGKYDELIEAGSDFASLVAAHDSSMELMEQSRQVEKTEHSLRSTSIGKGEKAVVAPDIEAGTSKIIQEKERESGQVIKTLLETVFGLKTAQIFFKKMFDSILHAPMSFFDTTPSGRILSRASADQTTIDDVLAFFVGLTISMYISVLSTVAWPSVIAVIPLLLLNIWYKNRYLETSRELTRLEGVTNAPAAVSEFVGMSLSHGLALNSLVYFAISTSCMLENDMIAVERVNQFSNLPSEAPWKIEGNLPSLNWPTHGDIDIKDLKVRYRPNTPLILKGINALKRCQLKNVVASKPEKLDAPGCIFHSCESCPMFWFFIVVDSGENWSVGQKQLLCLGRVILKRTRILFMDEATASVDSQTDATIQKITRREFKSCTIISIAHRIPTVMDCDRVLVLDEGLVKEFDAPSRLMEQPSLFGAMVQEYGNRSSNL
ncbi:ABC transporter C family member 14 [Panicum miliaceum]|uniref:ABC transporter C family member 14 n=1 Tax=Panicum miliaceum TaxID=4540 RepID=A0A3L6Q475_PANMI|nr:ABC transporter C family member 14 [Panicum miliaceum]